MKIYGKTHIILEPTLQGRRPEGGTRNRLTYTEQSDSFLFGHTGLGRYFRHSNLAAAPAAQGDPEHSHKADAFRATSGRYWASRWPTDGTLTFANKSSANPTGDTIARDSYDPQSLHHLNENNHALKIPFEFESLLIDVKQTPQSAYATMLAQPQTLMGLYTIVGDITDHEGTPQSPVLGGGLEIHTAVTIRYNHNNYALGTKTTNVPATDTSLDTLANAGYTNWRKYCLGGQIFGSAVANPPGLFHPVPYTWVYGTTMATTLGPNVLQDHVFTTMSPYDRNTDAYRNWSHEDGLMGASARGNYNYFQGYFYEELDEHVIPNSYAIYHSIYNRYNYSPSLTELLNYNLYSYLLDYGGELNEPTTYQQINSDTVDSTIAGAQPRPYLEELARRYDRISTNPDHLEGLKKRYSHIGLSDNVMQDSQLAEELYNAHNLFPMSTELEFDSYAPNTQFFNILRRHDLVDALMFEIMRANMQFHEEQGLPNGVNTGLTRNGAEFKYMDMAAQITSPADDNERTQIYDLYDYEPGEFYTEDQGIYYVKSLDFFSLITEMHMASPLGQGLYADTPIGEQPASLAGHTTDAGIKDGYGLIVGGKVRRSDMIPTNSISSTEVNKLKLAFQALCTEMRRHNRAWTQLIDGDRAYSEPLYYKVVKKDEYDTIIQNYYIPRSSPQDVLQNVKLSDTQIKYGKRYKYEVYEYNLVIGTEYYYKNVQVSPNEYPWPGWHPRIDRVIGFIEPSAHAQLGAEDSTIQNFHLGDFHVATQENSTSPRQGPGYLEMFSGGDIGLESEAGHWRTVFLDGDNELTNNNFFLDIVEYDQSLLPIQNDHVSIDLGDVLKNMFRYFPGHSWTYESVAESIQTELNQHPDLTYEYFCKFLLRGNPEDVMTPEGGILFVDLPQDPSDSLWTSPSYEIRCIIATHDGIVAQGLEDLFDIPTGPLVPIGTAESGPPPVTEAGAPLLPAGQVEPSGPRRGLPVGSYAPVQPQKSPRGLPVGTAAPVAGLSNPTGGPILSTSEAPRTGPIMPGDILNLPTQRFKILWRTGRHGWEPSSPATSTEDHGTCNFAVRQGLSAKIIEVPFYTTEFVAARDFGPSIPEIELVPYRGNSNEMLFLLNAPAHSYSMLPIVIEPEDEEIFNLQREAQGRPTGPIVFQADDRFLKYQVYRLNFKPTSYTDFAGSLRETVDSSMEMMKRSTGASFKDSLLSNQKYYYTFRTVDGHDQVSNPTAVYEVELVDYDGRMYPIISTVQFEAKPEPTTRSFKKYISIAPSLLQRTLPPASSLATSAGDLDGLAPSVLLGSHTEEIEDRVWGETSDPTATENLPCERTNNKTYKIRITSKSTGKKLDLNIKFTETPIINPERE
tara:strand:- start:17376 stop:21446 length:4071 start_codon:yes stop_codon:yes gene_type:complete